MPNFTSASVPMVSRNAMQRLWDEDAPLPSNSIPLVRLSPKKSASASPSPSSALAPALAPSGSKSIFPDMPAVVRSPRRSSSAAPILGMPLEGALFPQQPAIEPTPRALHGSTVTLGANFSDPSAEPLAPIAAPIVEPHPSHASQSGSNGDAAGSSRAKAAAAVTRTQASFHSRHILSRSQRIADKDSPLFQMSKAPDPRPPKPPG